MSKRKSILFLAAEPKTAGKLRLGEESRDVGERLRLAGYGKLPIHKHDATRVRDIQQSLLDFDPQIVHFSGHGAGDDGLVFEDETGHGKLVDAEALADLFRLFSDRVECVVLNACESKPQAEAIARHVTYVIGTSRSIGDQAAIAFAVGFYTAVGAGKSFEFAFEMGCSAIRLEGIPEYRTPVLYRRPALPLQVLLVSNAHYYGETPFRKNLNSVLGREAEVVRWVGTAHGLLRNRSGINTVLVDPSPPTANSFDQVQEFIEFVRRECAHVNVIVICGQAGTILDFQAAGGGAYQRFLTLDYERAMSSSEELQDIIRKCEYIHRNKHARR